MAEIRVSQMESTRRRRPVRLPRWSLLFVVAIPAVVSMLVPGLWVGNATAVEASSASAALAVASSVSLTPTRPPIARPDAVADAAPITAAASDTIRPLTAPVMSRVADAGPAPARKQGTRDPNPSTAHVIVVDGDSGAILFQRNAYEPVAPASLTKIMTAILGVERGNLSDHVKVNVDAGSMPGSSLMGLEPWFDVTFQDLLYGMMLPSGNDAALAISRYVAGNDTSFVGLMNAKAGWLGLNATHFANPHGLDASDHYSSPFDMVVMARYAMQYPIFREVVASKSYEVRESNIDITLPNVNPILDYPGADGVKSGLTDSAGRALVGTAVQGSHRVYVAFMRSENGDAVDGALLFNWAFDSFVWPNEAREMPR